MNYIAQVYAGCEHDSSTLFTGRGASPEEAQRDCIRKITDLPRVLIALSNAAMVPVSEMDRVPVDVPAGCQLIVFERSSHNSGYAYSWRYFAIPFGSHEIVGRWMLFTDSGAGMINTVDSNSDALYRLPKGSMEYRDGQWVQSAGVDYNY